MDKQETVAGILRFISMLFLIFEKWISRKTVPDILKFVSMFVLIFEMGISKKMWQVF